MRVRPKEHPDFNRVAHYYARRSLPNPLEANRLGIEVDDLVSLGVMAGLAAIECFDPNRGATLKSWCHKKIRYAIQEQLVVAGIKVSVPVVGERSERYKTHESEHLRRRISFEDLEGDARLLEDDRTGPEAAAIYADMLRYLARGVRGLEARRREVVELRYWGNLSYIEAGRRMGISETRAYQLHAEAIVRLRAWMMEETT